MAKHPAHAHVAKAKASAQKNHEEVMAHLANIEQALQGGPQQDQDQGQDKMAPVQPGMSMPDGSSPLGGKAS